MSSANSTKRKSRAVLYLRVSTRRQAEHELSLVDQRDRCEGCAAAENADVVKVFIDEGRSAHGDARKRPRFQEMIRFVRDPGNQVDLVIGYAFSRLFRRAIDFLNYREELELEGIKLVSATQFIPEGPNGRLMANLIAMFDDHASEVNAGVVRDVMIANAEAGYWNGSAPPLGYKTVVATVLRKKEKKVLAVEPSEAALVNRIFRLYVHGEPGSGVGRIGIKAIATFLNTRSVRWRGRLFSTSFVEDVLKNEAYIGTYYYNRMDSRTKKPRPRSEWVALSVPAIVDPDLFDAAQRLKIEQRPDKRAPRVVNGPTLLTGLAVCEKCGEGMMLRTGKGGRYRYLTCARAATKGVGCRHSVKMENIDAAVLKAVSDRVFAAARLRTILQAMLDQSNGSRAAVEAEIAQHRAARTDATTRLRRLYDTIEAGIADLDDPELKQRIDLAKLQVREAERLAEALSQRLNINKAVITDAAMKKFADTARARLRDSDPSFRRNWLHLFVDRVVVGPDKIVIRGSKQALFSVIEGGDKLVGTEVPSFARKWRARRDSNS